MERTERIAYRVQDAANAIGLSRSRIYELIGDGSLDARKVGGRTVIPASSLHALLERSAKVAA
jgi:excisionase family DNA binding protein